MPATHSESHLTQRLHQLLDDLTAVRDEARLQRHLMALDTQTRLDRLEREYDQLRDSFRSATEATVESWHEAASKLRAAFAELAPPTKAPPTPTAMPKKKAAPGRAGGDPEC